MVVRDGRLRWPVPGRSQELVDLTIHRVSRRAKYLLLETDFGTAILHLGMSGSLRVLDIGTPAEKHDHVDIELENGKLLRLNDPRRFGALLWTREPAEAHTLLAKLGPEPLTDAFNADYLRERAKGRSTAIKTFLMDNQVVVGVGNIYANEALYAAGIHPKRAAGNISAERLSTLVGEIKRVLAEAIRQGAPPSRISPVQMANRVISCSSCRSTGGAASPVFTATPCSAKSGLGSVRLCSAPTVSAELRFFGLKRPSCKRVFPVC